MRPKTDKRQPLVYRAQQKWTSVTFGTVFAVVHFRRRILSGVAALTNAKREAVRRRAVTRATNKPRDIGFI